MENERKTSMCSCPYCGQVYIVEVDNPDDPQACEAAAIRECKCDGARLIQRRDRMIERAKLQIDEAFGPKAGEEPTISPRALELLKEMVPLVYSERILEVKAKLTDNITAKIGKTRSGNLVVEQKFTSGVKAEVGPDA